MSEGWFYRFCAALDTPGGHILSGFALVVLGGAFFLLKIGKSEELIVAGSVMVTFAAKGLNGKGAGVQPPPVQPTDK